ncbi:MAG: YfdX family protein [Acetobacter syzygii]|uniref:YfdX family protein n=1 Tax=Acetobacter syzygii TaxID=146476 RepID=UPI0039EA2868
MRFKASLAAVAALMVSASAAQADGLHTDWEKFKAGRALHHLSVDGQKAMQDVLIARDLLAQGKTDAAIPPIYDAQKRFVAAQKDNRRFYAAENQLQPAPQHPVSATHKPTTGAVTWIPVGGEFILTETLAPDKKAAAQQANQALKAGQNTQAQQNLQVVGEDADFIIALAPLEQTKSTLYRARVLTEGRQAAQAKEALDQLLDGIVFVSDDFVDQNTAAQTSGKGKAAAPVNVAPASTAKTPATAAPSSAASTPAAPASAPVATPATAPEK